MSSQERPFDLNELPAECCEDDDIFVHFQNSKIKSETPQRMVNVNTFSHSSSLSVFHPFVKQKDINSSEDSASEPAGIHDLKPGVCSLPKSEELERENGEWFDAKNDGVVSSSGLDSDSCDLENNSVVTESDLVIKKEIKIDEAKHDLMCGNIPGKRQRFDKQNVTKLGKKRNRQVVLLKDEDVQNIKTPTSRRKNIALPKLIPSSSNLNFENDKQCALVVRDNKHDISYSSGAIHMKIEESKSEYSGGNDLSSMVWHWKSDIPTPKPPLGSKSSMVGKHGNKKTNHLMKPSNIVSQYQDTSIERLLREVTNEKFWYNPESSELQCVPGHFESMDEYIRVFEPLLFEECRAQLYSTWEELTETVSKDHHLMIRVKIVERRDRGWCDAIVIPAHESSMKFKEGDIAILSSPRPGSVRSKRGAPLEIEEEKEAIGRVVGTVRRHLPVDKSDSPGAIFHFYVGDSYDSYSKDDSDHILNKLQPQGVWYLTVLGSLATTQREYIALHASRRLNPQMQNAILHPSPADFPKYELQPPPMPKCFTQNFARHLKKSFNGPQLASIQWAAMHTASKEQDPWPFTLVQGPPGTGKTHTVWGMLNVIHLVQYQQYYTALLQKLAPEIHNQTPDSGSESFGFESSCSGSMDELLKNMDRNLSRTLPKLCPKPRMLVCAPSNAAIDELLSRVLDRGFIDGEMKVYRPDVARVGMDVQTRAAQAVSVERRAEQLLRMDPDDVSAHMRNCRACEVKLSGQIVALRRELRDNAPSHRDSLLQSLAAAVESRDKNLVDLSRFLTLERAADDARGSLEASFANEAEIVFTTVSSSGRRLFGHLSHGFDMVVIDEAAQASEVSVLPPLSLDAARCVLVGDPQQLPATVTSKAAGSLLYTRSLFERFQQAGCPTILLSVQYRMHPQIREFPSRYFYRKQLVDSDTVSGSPDEIYHEDPLLRPYLFFDVRHGRESHRSGSASYQNVYEARFCLRMYERLREKSEECHGKVRVGVITPYRLQLKCLRHEFEGVLKTEEGRDVCINTVDAFQGQERDVVIMSCVRASSHGVGFVADVRRMNVALTRARRALWVMGNANALSQSDDWAALISDAKARNCYMGMESLPQDFIVSKEISPRIPVFGGPRSMGPGHRSMGLSSRSATPSRDDERSQNLVGKS